jgi:meso-butanediol dehydrogenase/(S,S)-butanediol dehydrogenase/diacetyl reductase
MGGEAMTKPRLDGKSCIVTGAARGIGRGIARRLADEGGRVCVADVNAAGAEETASLIAEAGGQALAVSCDVTDRESVRSMIAAAVEAFGRLDVIFNNAGIAQAKPFLELEDDDWHRMMDVNAFGVFLCMQEAARCMLDQGGGGKIVNTASTAGKQAYPHTAHYGASKFAVVALTQAGARAWGAEGITVNAICPGFVGTDMWDQLEREFRAMPTTPPDFSLADANPDLPLVRHSTPEDIAGLAAFLASADSDYMTGQAVNFDGGLFMQ